MRPLLLAACLAVGLGTVALAKDKPALRIAAGTTVENSGLADVLVPAFEAASGYKVELLPMGTGQALRVAENGDVDVIIVHSPKDEEAFMHAGFGSQRHAVMVNDFVIVGPPDDPAGVRQASKATDAYRAIAAAKLPFISRGDESGTHQKELMLWDAAGIGASDRDASWYRAVGSGMGATLNIAAASAAYAMSDRGTWGSFVNRMGLVLLFEGDPLLDNQYSVITVNAQRHPHVNAAGAQAFAAWLTGSAGQTLIGNFRPGGQQLFKPNARPGS